MDRPQTIAFCLVMPEQENPPSIKAIMNEFYSKGLRLIEVYKHQFKDLPKIISQIKSRNYKFIIYMDDLSFEEFEIEYKYLKAVIEGGLETKPDNVLIYATSNRRHLIKESFDDVRIISQSFILQTQCRKSCLWWHVWRSNLLWCTRKAGVR